jgi:hypothetical protein
MGGGIKSSRFSTAARRDAAQRTPARGAHARGTACAARRAAAQRAGTDSGAHAAARAARVWQPLQRTPRGTLSARMAASHAAAGPTRCCRLAPLQLCSTLRC